jgi:hypothetical protein
MTALQATTAYELTSDNKLKLTGPHGDADLRGPAVGNPARRPRAVDRGPDRDAIRDPGPMTSGRRGRRLRASGGARGAAGHPPGGRNHARHRRKRRLALAITIVPLASARPMTASWSTASDTAMSTHPDPVGG